MIDWIRIKVLGTSALSMINHLSLSGDFVIEATTGDVIKQTIKYNEFITINIRRNNYVTIVGSIHKSYQKGNYNRFTYSDLKKALNNLCNDLRILKSDCKITRIEFGVNIFNPELGFDTIYQNALCYRGEPFNTMRYSKDVFGLAIELSRYVLKIYSKSKQISKSKILVSDEILRYEIRIKNSIHLKSIGITTLEDVFDKAKIKMVNELLIAPLQFILFDDADINFNNSEINLKNFLLQVRIPKFWSFIKTQGMSQYNSKKYSFQTILKKKAQRIITKFLVIW